MLLERLGCNAEPLAQLCGRDVRARALATAVEQVGEQRLQEAEALGRDWGAGPLERLQLFLLRLLRQRLRLCLVALSGEVERGFHFPTQCRRRDRNRPAVLAQDPAHERLEARVLRDEDAVLDPPRAAVHALDPPRRVAPDLYARLAGRVADLPMGPSAVRLDVEVLGQPEVAFPPRRQPDLAPDPRDPEGPVRVAVVVAADHVPAAAVEEQGVRVDRPLVLLVPRDGVVVELDGALLRDCALELGESAWRLRRIVDLTDLHTIRCPARGPLEAGPCRARGSATRA